MFIQNPPQFAECIDCKSLNDEIVGEIGGRECSSPIILPSSFTEQITQCAYRISSKTNPFDVEKKYYFIPIKEKEKWAASRGVITLPKSPTNPDTIDPEFISPFPLVYEASEEICCQGSESSLGGKYGYACSIKHYVLKAVHKGPKSFAGPLTNAPRFEKICFTKNDFNFCFSKPTKYSVQIKTVSNSSRTSINISQISISSKSPFTIKNGGGFINRKSINNKTLYQILNHRFPKISISNNVIKWQIPKIHKNFYF